jgi:hypothetical protein
LRTVAAALWAPLLPAMQILPGDTAEDEPSGLAGLAGLVARGMPIEAAAVRVYPPATALGLWRAARVFWDRCPWWYLLHGGAATAAERAIRWAHRGGPGRRTEAGERVVEVVSAIEREIAREIEARRGTR